MEAVVSAARLRTYPVPKQVAAEAARSLDRARVFPHAIDEASLAMGVLLAGGGSLTADLIPLINDYFSNHQEYASEARMTVERGLWGGEHAERWTGKVLGEAQRAYATVVASALDTLQFDEECTYFGLCDPSSQEDIVSQLIRCRGDALNLESYDAQNAVWERVEPSEVRPYAAFELDREMVGFIASAFHSGTTGVVLQYAVPITFLPAAMIASVAQVDDVTAGKIYAVVDSTDNTAVMNVIKLVPGPKAYVRDRGRWNLDPAMLKALRGISPPKLVELSDEMSGSVISQVDMWNAANPTSAPQGAMELQVEDHSGPGRGMKTKSVRASALVEELRELDESLEEPILETEQMISDLARTSADREAKYSEETQKIRDRWDELGDAAVDTMLELKTARQAERDAERRYLHALEESRNLFSLRKRVGMQEAAISAAAEMRGSLNALELLESAAVCGAGGADRNQGNAETLRRYWLRGKGSLQIAWGTSGDFTRCVSHLRKYLGARTEEYCARRHHDANGFWPGDRRNK